MLCNLCVLIFDIHSAKLLDYPCDSHNSQPYSSLADADTCHSYTNGGNYPPSYPNILVLGEDLLLAYI